MENNNLFEGDMVLSPDEIEKAYAEDAVDPNAPLGARVSGHWPNGVIPYTMSSDIAKSAKAVKAINDAIKNYHEKTCLRFINRTSETAYINFVQGSGCSSRVGYSGRVNTINLAPGCWYIGIVAHEIAHSLGFYHEQSRPDRDHYVKILWQNIRSGMSHNFRKRGSDVNSMNVPYDFKSVMHYRATSFGDGKVTIDPYDPNMKRIMGQRGGLSDLDNLQMNLLYKCTGFTSPKPASLPPIPTTTKPAPTPRPTPMTNAAAAVNCDFKSGLCLWRNVAGNYDKIDWSRNRGSTRSTGTGPTADHTSQDASGYYVYIETSNPVAKGDFARLQSPLIAAASNSRCFSFYYHMYGSTTGKLSVYINYKRNSKDSYETLVFKKTGEQGNMWLQGQANIPPQAHDFEIVIEGESGGIYKSDIAIDDVSIKEMPCATVPTQKPTTKRQTTQARTTQARTTQARTTQVKTTFSPPKNNDVDCDFSQGNCKWVNGGRDVFDWIRNNGMTGSSGTGPSRDHTNGGSLHGYYLYIETSNPRKLKDNAVIKNEDIRGSSNPSCFEFWYHMYGNTINKLRVSLEINGSKKWVWALIGNQGNRWQKATIPIPPTNGNFSILMEGIRGKSYTGDIAIDDLKYISGSCQVSPPKAVPNRPTSAPTSAPVCFDNQISCPSLAKHCNSSIISNCVRANCKKTCGLCGQKEVCGISPVPPSRVIGGKDAAVGAWPWQAALRRASSGSLFCGGSLINNQWILTAAHCIGSSSPSYYKITLGDHNRASTEGTEQDFTVSKVFKHPNYHQGASYNNDAALLKLSRPVLVTKRISPVCLPTKSEVVAVGTKCYITGWGKIRHPGSTHNILQQALMPIRGKQECANRLAKSPSGSRLKITDQMVCAGYTGNSTIVSGCHGDSGGPLVCQKSTGEFQLHGAVSWGSPRCKIQERFTVFARITAIRDWIDQTVARN